MHCPTATRKLHSVLCKENHHLMGHGDTLSIWSHPTHPRHTFNRMLFRWSAPCNSIREKNHRKRPVFCHILFRLGAFRVLSLLHLSLTSHFRNRLISTAPHSMHGNAVSLWMRKHYYLRQSRRRRIGIMYSPVELLFGHAWDNGTRRSSMQQRWLLLSSRIHRC